MSRDFNFPMGLKIFLKKFGNGVYFFQNIMLYYKSRQAKEFLPSITYNTENITNRDFNFLYGLQGYYVPSFYFITQINYMI